MRTKTRESKSAKEVRFELKYCERCGGLWLRPAGGGQIYCTACGREMAKLPPASREQGNPRMPQGPRWGVGESDFESFEGDEGVDLDASGGVA